LMILGSESQIVDEEQRKRVRELAPHVEMETIQGAGHYPIEDKPDAFESTVRNFLHRHNL